MRELTPAIESITLGNAIISVSKNNLANNSYSRNILVTDASGLFDTSGLKNEMIDRSYADGGFFGANLYREAKSFTISGLCFGATPKDAVDAYYKLVKDIDGTNKFFTVSCSYGKLERCILESSSLGDFSRAKSDARAAVFDFEIQISSENARLVQ